MPIWQTQMLGRTMKSLLPFEDRLRHMKRRFSPYDDDDSNGLMAVRVGIDMMRRLRAAGADFSQNAMELGTGWLPVVALLLHLEGVPRLVLTDVRRLMDDLTIERARRLLRRHIGLLAAGLDRPEAPLLARLDEPFQYDYLVPWRPEMIADASVGIIVSRTVLEHIPAHLLEDYFRDFSRILRPDGVMCHNVDNSDHWQHRYSGTPSARAISRVNFLRYEPDNLLWRLAGQMMYQNRWRHSDYLTLFERHGWVPVVADGEPDANCLEDLRTLKLSRAFVGRDHADLAILSSNFVLRRSKAAAVPKQAVPVGQAAV